MTVPPEGVYLDGDPWTARVIRSSATDRFDVTVPNGLSFLGLLELQQALVAVVSDHRLWMGYRAWVADQIVGLERAIGEESA